MKILITGAAGFIGHALALRMLAQGDTVVGIDNLNDYYDVSLKQARLDHLTPHPAFLFVNADIADRAAMSALFADKHLMWWSISQNCGATSIGKTDMLRVAMPAFRG